MPLFLDDTSWQVSISVQVRLVDRQNSLWKDG